MYITLWILHILQMLCFRFLPTLGWETKHWEGQKWGWIEIEWSAWKRSNIFTALFLFKNIINNLVIPVLVNIYIDRKYTGSDFQTFSCYQCFVIQITEFSRHHHHRDKKLAIWSAKLLFILTVGLKNQITNRKWTGNGSKMSYIQKDNPK